MKAQKARIRDKLAPEDPDRFIDWYFFEDQKEDIEKAVALGTINELQGKDVAEWMTFLELNSPWNKEIKHTHEMQQCGECARVRESMIDLSVCVGL